METNESILTRSIVGLDERKVLGKMSSLRVDYDTQAVSHYIVLNASTNNAIALPFENAIERAIPSSRSSPTALSSTLTLLPRRNSFPTATSSSALKSTPVLVTRSAR